MSLTNKISDLLNPIDDELVRVSLNVLATRALLERLSLLQPGGVVRLDDVVALLGGVHIQIANARNGLVDALNELIAVAVLEGEGR
ncbi:hypothetical protein [Caulobacter soli]|uniref:hypothetical protein n=1 Tax=Caulobacter soli TaxID=2708539 RepID=UPI0013EB8BA8|nr:hypothetical protein [Caulobacter soli]